MAMRLLNELLPSDVQPDWCVIKGDLITEELKDREFLLFEYFCDNPSCYCESVIVQPVEIDEKNKPFGKPLAVIYYDWSKPKTRCKPELEKEYKQSKFAPAFLKMYRNLIHTEEYMKRLTSQYKQFKSLCELNPRNESIEQPRKRTGRNDPCPCGSGEKYKKCCLLS